jgi:5-methylcytosine-specific restriction endonuclease McrA
MYGINGLKAIEVSMVSGMNKGFYASAAWRAIRVKALARDRYCCTHCGVSVKGFKKSRVDHIIPTKQRPELALTLSNLRTLCAVCDNRRHADKLGNEAKDITPTGVDGWPMGMGGH